jgi:hypothetical protein
VPKNALRFRYPATNPIRETFEMPRRPWTEDEHERARDMRAAGDSYGKIDKVLGRHAGATQQRLEIAGYGSGHHQVRSSRIPDSLFAEREALAVAPRATRVDVELAIGGADTGSNGSRRVLAM